MDASSIVGEEHQNEQEAVRCSRDHEQIGRHDWADVNPQERGRGLRWRLAPAPHIFRDGRLTDVDLEFQQLAMNPRRTTIVVSRQEVAILWRRTRRPEMR